MTKGRDRGFAMVAAVAGIAAFAWIGLEAIAANRGAIAGVDAHAERAELEAAADAGLMLAIHGLATPDRTQRWSFDSRPRNVKFGDADLTITVEDERGKIPLNSIEDDQVRAMFEAAGAEGERLDGLVDAFEDWRDEDDDRRADGAEAADYLAQGIRPRNGQFLDVDELMQIKGMDRRIFDRLAPNLTVFFGNTGGFSPRTAQPLALAVMSGHGGDDPASIDRERDLEGEAPALQIEDDVSLVGRDLTVRVVARDGRGGGFRRAAVIELTGSAAQPYWIRYVD